MPHKAGPGFRLAHDEDMTKGIKAAIYESTAALIALVREAAAEIERLNGYLASLRRASSHGEVMAITDEALGVYPKAAKRLETT
jgi:hypothetical protein